MVRCIIVEYSGHTCYLSGQQLQYFMSFLECLHFRHEAETITLHQEIQNYIPTLECVKMKINN